MSIQQTKILLFLFQLLAHVSFIAAIFMFSAADWGIAFFVYFLTGCLGVTVTYHRFLSHKSWKPPQWWIYIGSILGSWGIVGSPIAWANNHSAHHRYVDTEKDPHSMQHQPWWKVQWLSMFTSYSSFRFALANTNKFQMFIHKYYFHFHIAILVALVLIAGVHLTMVLYLVPAAILWNAASLVNTINHSVGYRNFKTNDSSTNNVITGFLTWGEGWHNNHHYQPGNPNFGIEKYEFDLSYQIIKLIEAK